LKRRFERLLEQVGNAPGESIPLVCQDWANTKAAYRFLSNERVSEAGILPGHFQSTRERFAATDGPVLVLHDTSEFTYKREDIQAVGKTRIGIAGAALDGRPRYYTACGILMHSSLAVTTEGLPLGLSAIKFWTREKFKGANELKRHINPTRVPIEQKESIRWLENLKQSSTLFAEPSRCVHIGDRESNIFELFCAAEELGTQFLVRTCVDRLASDGAHTIADEMAEVACKGLHRVAVEDKNGNVSEAVLELRYRRIRVLPPIGKQKQYPALVLTVLHAQERDKPRGRERVDWKLLTNLPVTCRAEAVEKLQWYALRWKIETFHKILKSGCMQSRRVQAAYGGAPGKSHFHVLHPELENLLADDDQSHAPSGTAHPRVHDARHQAAGSIGPDSASPCRGGIRLLLSHATCATGRVSRTRSRSAARQLCHLEGHVQAHGHRARLSIG